MIEPAPIDSNLDSDVELQLPASSANVTTSRIAILREAQTPLGRVELRRRWSLALEHDVFEIFLSSNLMMSSAVHVSEDALAERGLAEIVSGDLNVLVGGLGLGFTALRVLADERVSSVAIIELLTPVIEWHREGVIPWSSDILGDKRVEVIQDDFFSYLTRPLTRASKLDLILIDIDDGPDDVWHSAHAAFYTKEGLEAALSHIRPGGVLAFWFALPPGDAFLRLLGQVVHKARIETVPFYDPSLHQQREHYVVLGCRDV